MKRRTVTLVTQTLIGPRSLECTTWKTSCIIKQYSTVQYMPGHLMKSYDLQYNDTHAKIYIVNYGHRPYDRFCY